MSMKFSKKSSLQTRAQTVVELAVFGAILVFILGIMIRQSLTFNYAQSQNFKAMRMAMAESFKTAETGHAARNSASLIFIEDRISAEIGKYGALTRTPAFASGSATFSKNLSMPIDYPSIATDGNPNICNSKYPACVSHDCSGALFYDGGSSGEGFLGPLKNKEIEFAWNPFMCSSAYAESVPPVDPMSHPCCSPCNYVDCQITPDNDCCTKSGCEAVNCTDNPGHSCCPPQGCPAAPDCVNNPQDPCCFSNGCPFVNCAVTPGSECCFNPGCKIVNCASDPANDCCQTGFLPPGCDSQKDLPIMDMFINGKHFTFTMAGFREYNLTQGSPSPYPEIYSQDQWDADWNQPLVGCANMRVLYAVVPNFSGEGIENTWKPNCGKCFDLDRDGTIDVLTPAEQADFEWQWQETCATTGFGPAGINLAKNQHVRLDVDGDLKEETILQMVDEDGVQYTPFEEGRKGNHRVIKVRVLDDQAGDIDNTWSKNPATNGGKHRPGLRDELQIYTYTQEGTYLLLEEGKDVIPNNLSGNQGTVSTQKRNNADIIQRMIQLSNHTGRFCQGGLPNTMENPDVEVCATNEECFNPQNIYQTCFAVDTLMLYVRSRIGDLRGRKWITDLGTRGY